MNPINNILINDVPIVVERGLPKDGPKQCAILRNLGPLHALLPSVLVAAEEEMGGIHYLSLQAKPRVVPPGETIITLDAEIMAESVERSNGARAANAGLLASARRVALFIDVVSQFSGALHRTYRIRLVRPDQIHPNHLPEAMGQSFGIRTAEIVKPGDFTFGAI